MLFKADLNFKDFSSKPSISNSSNIQACANSDGRRWRLRDNNIPLALLDSCAFMLKVVNQTEFGCSLHSQAKATY